MAPAGSLTDSAANQVGGADGTTVKGTEFVKATGSSTIMPTTVMTAAGMIRRWRDGSDSGSRRIRRRVIAASMTRTHRSSEMANNIATPKVTMTPNRSGRMSDSNGTWAKTRHG